MLIITIIVLAIITGVIIYYINKGDIIVGSEETVTGYNERLVKEQVEVFDTKFIDYSTHELTEPIKNQMVQLVLSTKIKLTALTVIYDKNTQTEHVVYRYDKTTEDERAILEAAGVNMLKGDTNLDGFLSTEDVIAINNHAAGSSVLTNEQFEVADVNDDGVVDVYDVTVINNILAGTYSYQGGVV